jgi:RimJ/RimL family protein N-acetyltransferase
MLIILPECTIRDWRTSDAASLAQHANDRRIWLNMRDAFPHPYTTADADAFLATAAAMRPLTWFAVSVNDAAVGGIGYTPHDDVERGSAEIGYWLGTAFWGRGIMTAALTAVTTHAFRADPDLRRLYAVPYVTSAASARILEKAGFRLEGRMRQSVVKNGQVLDQFMYGILRDEALGGPLHHDGQ